MARFCLTIASTLFVACLVAGCSNAPPESPTIRTVAKLTLYEGLPHPMYNSAELASEKKSKPTIARYGFDFYAEPRELTAGDQEKLKAILGDAKTYAPFAGEKKCGGFHPDFAVEWTLDGQTHACLICFTCGEFLVIGPNGRTSRRSRRIWSWAIRLNFDRKIGAPSNHASGSANAK